MDIIAMLKELFGMTRAVSEEVRQRDAEKNAPDVKAAAIANQEQSELDKTNKAIAAKDTKEIRDELSET